MNDPSDSFPDDPAVDDPAPDDPAGGAVGDNTDDPTDDAIPPVVLAVIRDRMHARRLSDADDPGHIEETLGSGDDVVSVVDDGPDKCMIGRLVGRADDGSVYCLVARVPLFSYEQVRDGEKTAADAFSDSRDISLSAVFEVDGVVENIALVAHYRHADRVPTQYLPGQPFLEFSDEDSPTDEE
jgi:hypothetical protein